MELSRAERVLATASLFRPVQHRSEAHEVRKGAHQTALFVALMALALGVLLSRVSTEETVRVTVDRPSLEEYRAAAANKPDCPCVGRSIARGSFAPAQQEPNPYVRHWLNLCTTDAGCSSAGLSRSVDAVGPVHLTSVKSVYSALWLFAVRFDTAERAAVELLDAIVYRDHDLVHESELGSRVQSEDAPIRGQLIGATRYLSSVLLSYVVVAGGVPVSELTASGANLTATVSSALCASSPLSCNALAIVFLASAAELNEIATEVFSNETLRDRALVGGTDLGYGEFLGERTYISTSPDFPSYYSMCAPQSCSYVITGGRSAADLVSTLLGVLGGLAVFVRAFVGVVFALPPLASRYAREGAAARKGHVLSEL